MLVPFSVLVVTHSTRTLAKPTFGTDTRSLRPDHRNCNGPHLLIDGTGTLSVDETCTIHKSLWMNGVHFTCMQREKNFTFLQVFPSFETNKLCCFSGKEKQASCMQLNWMRLVMLMNDNWTSLHWTLGVSARGWTCKEKLSTTGLATTNAKTLQPCSCHSPSTKDSH